MSTTKFFDIFRSPSDPGLVRTQVVEGAFRLQLPSAIEGSLYDAVCTASWAGDPQGPPADLEELRRQVFYQARPVTTQRSVHEIELTGIELRAHLRRIRWAEVTNMVNPVVTVQLSASPEASRIAAEWEGLRSRLAVERMRNKLEIEQLRHLREDIFEKPAVARTYWLKHHPEAPAEILDDRFERIAEKLGTTPESSTMMIANLLRDFLSKLGPEHHLYLIDQLHRVFGAFERDDLAAQLTSVSMPGREANP